MSFNGSEIVPFGLSNTYVVTLNQIHKNVNPGSGQITERYYCTCQVAVNFIARVDFEVTNTLPTQVVYGGRVYIT